MNTNYTKMQLQLVAASLKHNEVPPHALSYLCPLDNATRMLALLNLLEELCTLDMEQLQAALQLFSQFAMQSDNVVRYSGSVNYRNMQNMLLHADTSISDVFKVNALSTYVDRDETLCGICTALYHTLVCNKSIVQYTDLAYPIPTEWQSIGCSNAALICYCSDLRNHIVNEVTPACLMAACLNAYELQEQLQVLKTTIRYREFDTRLCDLTQCGESYWRKYLARYIK